MKLLIISLGSLLRCDDILRPDEARSRNNCGPNRNPVAAKFACEAREYVRARKRTQLELRRVVRGEVWFDIGARALYASDGSNYRQAPIGVVVPRDNNDVIAAMTVCRKFGAPVFGRRIRRPIENVAAENPKENNLEVARC